LATNLKDPEEFDRLIAEALDELPEPFARYLQNVVVTSEDSPTREEMEELGLTARETLLGVYRGVPITRREANFAGLPDQIVIFRRPILGVCASRKEIVEQIRATVLHEIGHHFGLSDEDLP
jgi:predicted Zn-dependent protease with MMP-like domain